MLSVTRFQFAGTPLTLPVLNIRAITFQAVLIAAAVFLPSMAHAAGAPVGWLLPMHWPVILAGLAYGPAAGLAVGLFSPLVSLAFSGMPPVPFVFVMMAELGVYGFATGWLRGNLRWSAWLGVAVSLLAGRAFAIAIGTMMGGSLAAIVAAYAPGTPCAIAQVALLPLLANWWVTRENAPARKETTR